MKPESPTWFRHVVGFFQSYGGFVLGAFTVPLMLAFKDHLHAWIESFYVSSMGLPPAWFFVEILLNDAISTAISSLVFFGLYGFLGGLVGNHNWKTGCWICVISMFMILVVSYSLLGGPSIPDDWRAFLATPFLYSLFFLGVLLPYLLGFSLRRLVFLFVSFRT